MSELGLPAELPARAIDTPHRRQYFNRRRKRDTLGEGFACTWRTLLIKVAAEIITRARRVIVRLSASWPYLDRLLAVGRAVAARPRTPCAIRHTLPDLRPSKRLHIVVINYMGLSGWVAPGCHAEPRQQPNAITNAQWMNGCE